MIFDTVREHIFPCSKVSTAMKRSLAGATAAAVLGLSVITMSPATAAPFENCTAAENAGRTNIPVGDPQYGEHLDSDLDGIGCEDGGSVPTTDVVDTPDVVQPPVAEPNTPSDTQIGPPPADTTVVDAPPVNTGLNVDGGVEETRTGAYALGAAGIAALAAAGFGLRRRSA